MATRGWEAFPSYLGIVVPRVLEILDQRELKITFFVVGQDAALDRNHAALKSIADAGHEIGNHSFHHEPWLHLHAPEQIAEEFDAEAETASSPQPAAAPPVSAAPASASRRNVLAELARRGYSYDASTFPTFLGPDRPALLLLHEQPLVREMSDRKQLFGKFSEGVPLATALSVERSSIARWSRSRSRRCRCLSCRSM